MALPADPPADIQAVPDGFGETSGIDTAVACISANLLGIGNAATPLGIAAVREMQDGDEVARDDSIMLTVINTASLSLIPTTLLALRRASGAELLFELLPVIWLASGIGMVSSIIVVKIFAYCARRKRRESDRRIRMRGGVLDEPRRNQKQDESG